MRICKSKKIVRVFGLALLAVSFLALFSSCQDVIYWNIRNEVTLASANVKADIRSIVRFKDEFYCANGTIYRKSNTINKRGTWSKTSAPRTGQVLKLASDTTYLYALVGVSKEDYGEGENVPVRRELYYSTDGSTWSKVTGVYGNGDVPYNSSGRIEAYLFGTNAIAPANRKAYFVLKGGKAGYKAYSLNGANAAEEALGTENGGTKPVCNKDKVSQSCVYCAGSVHFFNSTGSCTNETTAGGDETMYYYGDGSTLRYGGANSGKVGAHASITSIACTKNFLLVGTSSGYTHHPLTAGVPGGRDTNLPYNAAATLSGQYTILAILVVNPENNETDTAIYASQNYTGNGSNSAQFDHICMWAYYPSEREWNRD